MMADFNIKYTSIELVHPPISSQEAVWYEQSSDPELEALLRLSQLYMIGGRPEAAFGNFQTEDEHLCFDLVVGGETLSRSCLDIYALEAVQNRQTESVDLELGDKIIWIRESSKGDEEGDPLDWFTVDKLAWDHARGRSGLEGVVVPRPLITFDLLYVGIANKTDSYDRLIERGHKAKAEILANEPQRFPGARVSDEIYFFLFRHDSLFIRTIGDDWSPPQSPPAERIVADLEKAFISQLGPSYNRIRYKGYPAGKDGLFESMLDRYGYGIAEDLVFRTASDEFRGARDLRSGLADGDLLFVDGMNVAVVTPA
jgi:hypothetical protein